MDTTPRLLLQKPTLTGPGDLGVTQLRTALTNHAAKLDDAALVLQGPEDDLPTPGLQGRFYFADDTDRVWHDDGASWSVILATATCSHEAPTATTVSAITTLRLGTFTSTGQFTRTPISPGDGIYRGVAANNPGRYRFVARVKVASGGTGTLTVTPQINSVDRDFWQVNVSTLSADIRKTLIVEDDLSAADLVPGRSYHVDAACTGSASVTVESLVVTQLLS